MSASPFTPKLINLSGTITTTKTPLTRTQSPILIFVIGCPGSGKGTICSNLLRQIEGLYHLSVGDLLRTQCNAADPPPDPEVLKHVVAGTLVGSEKISRILRTEIRRRQDEEGENVFLIDGFPRALEQAYVLGHQEQPQPQLQQQMQQSQLPQKPWDEKGENQEEEEQQQQWHLKGEPDLVLFFNCPKDIARQRYLTRQLDTPRDQDPEMFERRHAEFERLNPEVVRAFQATGVLVEVDSSGDVETTFQLLLDQLEERGEFEGWFERNLITPRF